MSDKQKCGVCNGSGYVGPDQPIDTPSSMRIIGCAPCSYCDGGYKKEFTFTLNQELAQHLDNTNTGQEALNKVHGGEDE